MIVKLYKSQKTKSAIKGDNLPKIKGTGTYKFNIQYKMKIQHRKRNIRKKRKRNPPIIKVRKLHERSEFSTLSRPSIENSQPVFWNQLVSNFLGRTIKQIGEPSQPNVTYVTMG